MKKSHLKSPDLYPIQQKDRTITSLGYSFMWVGMVVVLATFAIRGAGVQSLPLPLVILATVIGCLAIGFFISLIADIGIEHGLSFPVYMRAPFGTVGTHIPSIVRGISASMWFGINTYFGATAINGILDILWGVDNWFVCYYLINLYLDVHVFIRYCCNTRKRYLDLV